MLLFCQNAMVCFTGTFHLIKQENNFLLFSYLSLIFLKINVIKTFLIIIFLSWNTKLHPCPSTNTWCMNNNLHKDKQHTCRSPPAFTMAIMIFSADINGSSCLIWRSMTLGYTTIPSQMFCSVKRILSADRKASANVILLGNHNKDHTNFKYCFH